MRKTISAGLIAIAMMAVASSGWATALKVEPGLWKTSVTAHHGATSVPPQIRTHCVTQKDIDDFTAGLMLQSQTTANENCERTSFHRSATEVDWKYECTGRFTVTREGSIKFDAASHYTGVLKMTGNLMGQTIDESSIMEGTRVGDCPGKDAAGAAPPAAHSH
jgi:hypothetical protein